jgi:hypothetical protein
MLVAGSCAQLALARSRRAFRRLLRRLFLVSQRSPFGDISIPVGSRTEAAALLARGNGQLTRSQCPPHSIRRALPALNQSLASQTLNAKPREQKAMELAENKHSRLTLILIAKFSSGAHGKFRGNNETCRAEEAGATFEPCRSPHGTASAILRHLCLTWGTCGSTST